MVTINHLKVGWSFHFHRDFNLHKSLKKIIETPQNEWKCELDIKIQNMGIIIDDLKHK